MVTTFTYTNRSKDSTEYSEEGSHSSHDLVPRSCRWRVGVESLFTVKYGFVRDTRTYSGDRCRYA